MSDETLFSSKIIDDDILVIKLRGSLDAATSAALSAEVDEQFRQGKNRVIIDCARLGHVSSFGIGMLMTLQSRLRRRGGEVKLASVQAIVADVFKLVRLDNLLQIYGDVEFARQSFYE